MKKNIFMVLVLLGIVSFAHAQKHALTLQQCIDLATKQSYSLQAAEKSVERAKAMQGTAWDLDKTDLSLSQDPTSGGSPDNSISLSQAIEFPTVYVARRQQLKAETQAERSKMAVQKNALVAEVTSLYYQLLYEYQRMNVLNQQDSILRLSKEITEMRYKAGEVRKLDVLSADKVWRENQLEMAAVKSEANTVRMQLARLLNLSDMNRSDINHSDLNSSDLNSSDLNRSDLNCSDLNCSDFDIQQESLAPISYSHSDFNYQQTAEGTYAQDRLTVADKALKVAKNGYAPSLSLSLRNQLVLSSWNPYNQDRSKFDGGNFMGFEVGVGIPLFYGATKAKVKAARKEKEIAELEFKEEQRSRESEYLSAVNLCNTYMARLTYYQQEGEKHADELQKLGILEYQNGEISFIEYINALQESMDIKMKHAQAINDYNQSVIALKKLKGIW